jgi:hypothetical protein
MAAKQIAKKSRCPIVMTCTTLPPEIKNVSARARARRSERRIARAQAKTPPRARDAAPPPSKPPPRALLFCGGSGSQEGLEGAVCGRSGQARGLSGGDPPNPPCGRRGGRSAHVLGGRSAHVLGGRSAHVLGGRSAHAPAPN